MVSVRRQPNGLGKESVGFKEVPNNLWKVSDVFGKLSKGFRKPSDGEFLNKFVKGYNKTLSKSRELPCNVG